MKKISSLFAILLLSACASTKQFVPAASLETLTEENALINVERKMKLLAQVVALKSSQMM